jgi:hypothetical protein
MLAETNPDCSKMFQTAGRLEEMVVAELGVLPTSGSTGLGSAFLSLLPPEDQSQFMGYRREGLADHIWQKILSGEYQSFSIGGSVYVSQEFDLVMW